MLDKCVALVSCEDYNKRSVLEAVQRSFDLLGGIQKFVSPGQMVLLKPNLLQPAAPEKHITTHPEVISAVVSILKEHGCHVIIADSPGIPPYSEGLLRRLYKTSRVEEIALELGVALNFDTGYKAVLAPGSKLIKRFLIINPAVEADAIVVVSKAKTHVLTGMTGAAKNIFGIVPGLEKSALHARLDGIEDFSDMIIDLNELIKPRLQIMDAITGMEGNGPSAGRPRKIGTIIASSDYSAMDVVTSKLMSFDPQKISTIRAARDRGLLRKDLSDVRTIGEKLEDLVVKDFKRPSTKEIPWKGHFSAVLNSLVKPYSLKPVVIKGKCIGCETCYMICPKRAITISSKKAKIQDKDCIRCYCCHEMCPEKAIDLHRSFWGKALAIIIDRNFNAAYGCQQSHE